MHARRAPPTNTANVCSPAVALDYAATIKVMRYVLAFEMKQALLLSGSGVGRLDATGVTVDSTILLNWAIAAFSSVFTFCSGFDFSIE